MSKERLPRIRRFLGRKRPSEETFTMGEMGPKILQATKEGGDVKMVVTAQAGNPLFDLLPQVLNMANDSGAKAQVVLMMPEGEPDDATKKGLKRITDAQERSRPKLGIFPNEEVGFEDLEKLDLELHGDLDTDFLLAFIQDPERKDLYWMRKVGVEKGSMTHEGEEIPYVDFKEVDLGRFGAIPCPEDLLEVNVKRFSRIESLTRTHPELADIRGVVGVVRYTGEKEPSIESILTLAGMRFADMREAA